MAKRQLRSGRSLDSPDPLGAPPKKKQRAEVPRFSCTSCSTVRMSKFFPEVNPSSECDHSINTCKMCLKKWIEARVEGGLFETGEGLFGVRCPECPAPMREVNIQDAATKKVLQRFQELHRRHTADTVPGWRWCLNPSCKAGQVHEPKTAEEKHTPREEDPAEKEPEVKKTRGRQKSKQKEEEEEQMKHKQSAEEPDLCVCHECGHKACVPCDRPDHTPETCAGYQKRVEGRMEEDDKSRALLLKISKPCPACSKPIEKAGGCNNMLCSACNTQFCWECLHTVTHTACLCTQAMQQAQAQAQAAAFARAQQAQAQAQQVQAQEQQAQAQARAEAIARAQGRTL